MLLSGRREGDPRGNIGPTARVPGEGLERGAAAGVQVEAVLRALDGAGASGAEAALTISRWQHESHATLRDATGFS